MRKRRGYKLKCEDCNNLTYGTYCQKCYLSKYNPAVLDYILYKVSYEEI
jgi:hypothetical protein